MHPEGYIKKLTTGDFLYVYQHKDHLGNVRLNFADLDNDGVVTSSEILEEHNYYPFGGKHLGYNNIVASEHLWKFNNIEEEKSFGLNLYEMVFRQYDPSIGRFTGLDPVIQFSFSPFSGFNNNPAFWSDPSGAYGEQHDVEPDRPPRDEFDYEYDANGNLYTTEDGVNWCLENWSQSPVDLGSTGVYDAFADHQSYDNMNWDIEFNNFVYCDIPAVDSYDGRENSTPSGRGNTLRSIPIMPSSFGTYTWGDLAGVFSRSDGDGVGLYGIGEGHNLSDTKGSTSHDINAMDIPSNYWMDLLVDNFDFSISDDRRAFRRSRTLSGYYLDKNKYSMDTMYNVRIYTSDRTYYKGHNWDLRGADQLKTYLDGRVNQIRESGNEIDSIFIGIYNEHDVHNIHSLINEFGGQKEN